MFWNRIRQIKPMHYFFILTLSVLFLHPFAMAQETSSAYSYATPEDTAKSMARAVETRDVQGILNAVTDDYLMQRWRTTDRTLAADIIRAGLDSKAYRSIPVEGYELIQRLDNDGRVRIEYRVAEAYNDNHRQINAASAYLLKQDGDSWKIYGSDRNPTGLQWLATNPGDLFTVIERRPAASPER